MRLTSDDAREVRGFLRAHGLTVESAAAMLDRHRTTIHKKLQGSSDMSPCDLIELGIHINRRVDDAKNA